MNFRTTIFLLVVLVAAATVFFVTKYYRGGDGDGKDRIGKTDEEAERKLMSVGTSDVKRVAVTSAAGDRLTFERVEGKPSEWRIVEPVQAPAEGFRVDDFVRQVTDLRSRGQVEAGDKGVDQPQYTVELAHEKDKKPVTTTLKVGNRSPVGDMLYVRLDNESRADVVSASIVEQLEKQAADYRRARLLDVTNDKINSLAIAQGDKTLRLEKSAADGKWKIVEPKEMPGDDTQVSTLLSAVTSLDAVKFVAEDAGGAASYGLAKPTMTVTFTTEQEPTTQPSTGPAASTNPTTGPGAAANATTIKFGRPDVQKQNVYAMVSDRGPIVTVANTELEGLRKTPLDLRDREVLDLDANAISRITLSVDRAATTQPTSQPAEKRELVLERRSESLELGPPAPTTGPSTAPAPSAAEGEAPPAEPEAGDEGKPDAVEVDEATGDAPGAPDAALPGQPPPDAPRGEPAPAEPQSRVTTPDGGAVVSLAVFQDQPAPADAKPDEANPADANPAEPEAPPAAEPEVDPLQSVRDAVKAVTGDTAAATQPTTTPATQPAATQPAAPKSKWLIASEPKGDANDSHVNALINALRPMRAQKYLESFPTTQATPVATYVLKVSARAWGDEPAKDYEITITDPGGVAKPIAQMGDLVFEIDRTFLDKLTADFTEPNRPEMPEMPEGDMDPSDLLRQFGGGGGLPPGH